MPRDGHHAYRDDLSAAKARIAALEAELAARSPEAPDPILAERERAYARARSAADPTTIRVRSMLFATVPPAAAVLVIYALWDPFVSDLSGYASVLLLGCVLSIPFGLVVWWLRKNRAAAALVLARAELEETKRVRQLEREVAEARFRVPAEVAGASASVQPSGRRFATVSEPNADGDAGADGDALHEAQASLEDAESGPPPAEQRHRS
jgi:hypothetical protein